ncbi:HD domain-containing protein [Streptomyces sp. NPDC049954]|uniref:HD domain-containing protein n=1 Tax=Streptomyces sp. NPDC049954 TaxID=3155779 RepID=UPI00343E25B6
MRIPSLAEIEDLHKKYAPDADAHASVHTHCGIVWRIAEQLIESSGAAVDAELVRAGCLLHDIGVYLLSADAEQGVLGQGHYIRHGLLGHRVLAEEGWPEGLCRFCSCHTGVGLTQEDIVRQGLPLPPGDYVALTEEERLVMYADKFHSKSRPARFHTPEGYEKIVTRFGPDKVDAFRELRDHFGDPDIAALSAEFGEPTGATP